MVDDRKYFADAEMTKSSTLTTHQRSGLQKQPQSQQNTESTNMAKRKTFDRSHGASVAKVQKSPKKSIKIKSSKSPTSTPTATITQKVKK